MIRTVRLPVAVVLGGLVASLFLLSRPAAPLSIHDILGSYGFDDNARSELKKQGSYVDGDGVITLHKDGTFTSTRSPGYSLRRADRVHFDRGDRT